MKTGQTVGPMDDVDVDAEPQKVEAFDYIRSAAQSVDAAANEAYMLLKLLQTGGVKLHVVADFEKWPMIGPIAFSISLVKTA